MAKNDGVILRMQVDVGKAYDLLNMFKESCNISEFAGWLDVSPQTVA